jgi:hypothetical protein
VRHRVWIAGRRSGKSFLAVVEAVEAATRTPRARVWYIGPTFDQVRDLAWAQLKATVPPQWVVSVNETRLEMLLLNGSLIALRSAERPGRLHGVGLDFAVLDEIRFMDREVWESAIRPTLLDRNGRALFVTTPGGYDWVKDLYERGQGARDPEWASWQTTTAASGRYSEEELAKLRADLDPRMYRQEMEASFETLEGRVFSNFSALHNVRELHDNNSPLLVGMDFNVHPMTAVIGQRHGDVCHILDALSLPISNTEEMAQEIKQRFPGRPIVVCPDPSGRARKTSAPVGQTDFTILQRAGFIVEAPNAAPSVVDRINNVQALLLSADGQRRLYVHPRAKALLISLDQLAYKPGTNQPDKGGGLDHIADALGYLCWQRFKALAPKSGQRPFDL